MLECSDADTYPADTCGYAGRGTCSWPTAVKFVGAINRTVALSYLLLLVDTLVSVGRQGRPAAAAPAPATPTLPSIGQGRRTSIW